MSQGTVDAPETNPAYVRERETYQNSMRVYLVTGQHGGSSDTGEKRGPQIRSGDAPATTVTAANKRDWRAIQIMGERDPHPVRVVRLDVRCLARFQTFPDWYKLPDNKSLAIRVIGNAVPCLLAEKLVRQLVEVIE